jgi:quercetin dioxygenase-like cupin family protein
MFVKTGSGGYHSPIAGIEQKTLAYGEKTLMTEFRLKKGSVLPRHRHPHEQTGYLVSGRIRLFVDGRDHECGPGDSWCIAGDAEHGADVIEDAVAIEVFSPVRKEYIP